MSKRILVTGATGNVGGAVARRLVADGHHVRALVRSPSRPAAAALAALGVELARGDFDDRAACTTAATDMDAVFIVTTPAAGIDREIAQGCAMADAATAARARHVVLSSVADAQNGTGIPHFDSKDAIERHLRTLDVPWTSVGPAFFYENVMFPWSAAALKAGTWQQPLPPDTAVKMISVANIAAFVAHVVESPRRFAGLHVDIAADALTGPQVARALTAATGRPIEYVEQDLAAVADQFEDMARMYEWFRAGGFGVDIDALRAAHPDVAWTSFAEWAGTVDWDAVFARAEG